ncbi:MAG: transposase [candidate division Zixibacteria bacterium]|nr:transposase [candidate division Zixibacteria bacterium]
MRKAEEIAEIYRKRWDIELFFRWVKQYLRIKRCVCIHTNFWEPAPTRYTHKYT